MSNTQSGVEAQSPGGMSEIERLAGVFWSPGAAFQDIAARPRPWIPILLVIVAGIALTYAFGSLVGWEHYLEEQLAKNPQFEQLSPQQQRAILDQQRGFAGVMSYVGASAGPVILLLAVAGGLLLVFKIGAGAGITFKQSFGITVYAWLPNTLYTVLMLIALVVNPQDFNLTNPLPFNVAWFLDPSSTPAWMMALLGSFNLFTFWVIALLALGFSTASAKVRFGQALTMVLAAWLLTVVVKSGWAAGYG